MYRDPRLTMVVYPRNTRPLGLPMVTWLVQAPSFEERHRGGGEGPRLQQAALAEDGGRHHVGDVHPTDLVVNTW